MKFDNIRFISSHGYAITIIMIYIYCIFRDFKKALNDVILSRRAIRNMNTLYPDATPEELALSDNICIICRYVKYFVCSYIYFFAIII